MAVAYDIYSARSIPVAHIWRGTIGKLYWSRYDVPGELLLDTGGLVSLLDRRQTQHAACVRAFSKWTRPVLTTEPVITEAAHLLGRVAGGPAAVLRFVIEGGAILVPGSAETLVRANEILHRYADLELDYADATLVVLAEEVRSGDILTLDRKDFSALRWGTNRAFRIHPS